MKKTNPMKRIFCVILTIFMFSILALPSFAISSNDEVEESNIVENIKVTEVDSIFDYISEIFEKIIEFIRNLINPPPETPPAPPPVGGNNNWNRVVLTLDPASEDCTGYFARTREWYIVPGDTTTDIEIPDPERPGYKFLGWEPEIPETMSDQNVTCFAKWEKLPGYSTIYFDIPEEVYIDGIRNNKITQEIGSKIEPPEVSYRQDYEFIGWSPELPEEMPEEDLTVTAQWRKKDEITVIWKIYNGSEWEEIVQYYNKGDELNFIIILDDWPCFKKFGINFYFKGWSPKVSYTVTEDATYIAQYGLNLPF